MNLYSILILLVITIPSVFLSIQDIKKKEISWIIVVCQLGIYYLLSAFFNDKNILYSLIQGTVMFILYSIIRFVSREKFGWGDIIYGILQGSSLKFNLIWVCILLETVTALIEILIKCKILKRKVENIAFIPHMSAALIICFLSGLMIRF